MPPVGDGPNLNYHQHVDSMGNILKNITIKEVYIFFTVLIIILSLLHYVLEELSITNIIHEKVSLSDCYTFTAKPLDNCDEKYGDRLKPEEGNGGSYFIMTQHQQTTCVASFPNRAMEE